MFEQIKKQYGGVDVCINNAGLGHDAPLLSGATEHWRNMLEVRFLSLSLPLSVCLCLSVYFSVCLCLSVSVSAVQTLKMGMLL